MQLSDILGQFNKAKDDLTTFVKTQNKTNNQTRITLQAGEADVKQATSALKQINKIVGK